MKTFTALLFFTAAATAAPPTRPWNHDVIYFVLTDRFLDGDPANNVPTGSDPKLYDAAQNDIDRYHGGDLRGLELALRDGYFQALGVTALWITPPVRNVWNSAFDLSGAKTGYHGYWTQDFLDIDPHLTSAASLDGKTKYPATREGRLQHYRDFVALAHRRGVKVIQDIVCNHAGPVFYYDENRNGRDDGKDEWIPPYKRDGFYATATWANRADWNQHRTAPAGPLTLLGRTVATSGVLANFDSYGRKGMSGGSLGAADGEEIACDFFSLRDFWTDPQAAHFDALVDEFVAIYAFYLETIGVDGLRIDTVKHVHRAFWDAFTARLRTRLGPEKARRTLLFGEVYSGNPQTLGRFTYREDFAQNKTPSLDSLLNFQLNDAAREYLRRSNDGFGSAKPLEKMLRDLASNFYNPTPGLDGLNARQKAVNFVENHDGLNRFRVAGVSARQNLLANALALTLEGIPCLYYGTEHDLEDARGKIGHDGETGRLTLFRSDRPAQRDAYFKRVGQTPLARLTALRRELPALRDGHIVPLWVDGEASEDDGVFAFARYLEKDGSIDPAQTVVVVCNASGEEAATRASDHAMPLLAPGGRPLLREGEMLELMDFDLPEGELPGLRQFAPAWKDGQPRVAVRIPAQRCWLYRVVKAPAR